MAEYKVEASNPAGKASSVANIVLTRKRARNYKKVPFLAKSGRIAKTSIVRGGTAAVIDRPAADAPHFVAKLSDISARQGEKPRIV